MAAHLRPSAALAEGGDPFSEWTPVDYRLLEATNILDRDTCKSCGNPVWLCHTTHGGVQFNIMQTFCYGKAELEDYEKNPGNPEAAPGETRYAKAVGLLKEDGGYEPLPSRSEALAKIASNVLAQA